MIALAEKLRYCRANKELLGDTQSRERMCDIFKALLDMNVIVGYSNSALVLICAVMLGDEQSVKHVVKADETEDVCRRRSCLFPLTYESLKML